MRRTTSGQAVHVVAQRRSRQVAHVDVESVAVPTSTGVVCVSGAMWVELIISGSAERWPYRASAIVADLDEFFVHKLDTPQARRLEELDLRLDEQVECDLGYEEARTWAGRVANCGADVLVFERLRGLDARERVAKHVVEDVVDPCAAGELFGGDVDVRTLDGRDKVAGELRHKPKDKRALLCDAAVRLEMKAGSEAQEGRA